MGRVDSGSSQDFIKELRKFDKELADEVSGMFEHEVREAAQVALQQGIQEGESLGIQQGKEMERKHMLERMIREGLDQDTIKKIIG